MSQSPIEISRREARSMAIGAQLLADADPARSPHAVLSSLGAIQLDAMQRVDRSHRLVCLARNAALRGRESADEGFWSTEGEAAAFETWTHAASLVPVDDWPLWRFSREATRSVSWAPTKAESDRLVEVVRDTGPKTLRELELGGGKTSGWNWSDTKRAAEYLVWTGGLVCCARKGVQRVYDLPERRIRSSVLSKHVTDDEAVEALVAKAIAACGIATTRDLAEYFRLPLELVDAAVRRIPLQSAHVEGWTEPAWLAQTTPPRDTVDADPVFVSPFDSLVWDRARTRRIFEFEYTLEAYKPAAKRQYGYYVMPLVAGDGIRGRADLAREGDTLRVIRFFNEPGFHDLDVVRSASARLAAQLGCSTFTIDERPEEG